MDAGYWNSRYENGDTPWAHTEPAPALVHYLDSNRMPGTVLVPGCGFFMDGLAIAKTGSAVTGLDLSEEALKTARARVSPEYGVTFLCSNFLEKETLPKGSFDWVFEHTCFCAIEPQERKTYLESVYHVLKPSGKLMGIFLRSLEEKALLGGYQRKI